MNEALRKALEERSAEMGLPWCTIPPKLLQLFFEHEHVLLVDHRRPVMTAYVITLPQLARTRFLPGGTIVFEI